MGTRSHSFPEKVEKVEKGIWLQLKSASSCFQDNKDQNHGSDPCFKNLRSPVMLFEPAL